MVTGVPSNPHNQHLLAPTSRFENTDEYDDRESISESRHNSLMGQILDSLQQTARIMSSAHTQNSRVLQTHVPIFKGSPDEYNDFEHLLINYLQPRQNNMTPKAHPNRDFGVMLIFLAGHVGSGQLSKGTEICALKNSQPA